MVADGYRIVNKKCNLCGHVCMFVYADPECSFVLPVKFQSILVDGNDTKLRYSCFIKGRNTTFSTRNRIRNFNDLHSICITE